MNPVMKVAAKIWSLRLEGLTKAYPDNVLFQNLDLEFRPGMAIHVQGPNGSGKTQLMLVIAGLIDADSGRIHFRERDEILLSRFGPEIRSRFTRYVPYLPGGLAELSVDHALLVMTRRLHSFGLGSQKKAAATVVSELESELQNIARGRLDPDRPFDNYSIGQQKRFMAAASISAEPYPALVMLDEPLAGLDADGIARVLDLMQEAKTRGIALLVSEHRKEIFDFDFDSVLRLPYRPNQDASQLALKQARSAAAPRAREEAKTVFRGVDVVAGYKGCPVYCPDITVESGELVVISGPNGSGKTGFIRGLLGHDGTTLSGHLEFGGLQVPNLQQAQRQSDLRYLSQKRDLFLDLTVQESVTVAGRGHKTEMGREISDIVKFLGANKLVRHLSSGGRALLALAQALAGGPALLILDEPAANTDADNRQRVWDLVDQICRRGQTGVLAIEHDLILAPSSTLYQIQQQQDNSNVLIPVAKN